MLKTKAKEFLGSNGGSVITEAVICLPVIWLLAMGTAQLAFLQLCRQMVVYASYEAARAVVPMKDTDNVGNPLSGASAEEYEAALQAARRVCSTICFTGVDGSAELTRNWLPDRRMPGSGGLDGGAWWDADGAYRCGKVAVLVTNHSQTPWFRAVAVMMDVPLFFPVGGKVFSGLAGNRLNLLGHSVEAYIDRDISNAASPWRGYPHIRLAHVSVIGKPFHILSDGNLPANVGKWGE